MAASLMTLTGRRNAFSKSNPTQPCPRLCGSAIGRFDITGLGYLMETKSHLHLLTAFRTLGTICRAVIVGPDASLKGSFCPVASILTCAPPTSTTSTFILKPWSLPPCFQRGLGERGAFG